MVSRTLLVVATGLALIGSSVTTQGQVTVQLPTARSFTVQTTVVVPDSGWRPRSYTRRPRPPRGARTAHPLPKQLVGRQAEAAKIAARLHNLSSHPGMIRRGRRPAPHVVHRSLEAERSKVSRRNQTTSERDADRLLVRAREYERQGKHQLAATYYRMAARGTADRPSRRFRTQRPSLSPAAARATSPPPLRSTDPHAIPVSSWRPSRHGCQPASVERKTSCTSSALGPRNISLGGRFAWASAKASLRVHATKSSIDRHQVFTS